MTERRMRTIVKAVTWRATATLITAGLVYAFTGRLSLAAQVGILELVLKILAYYLHERIWGRVSWGRPKHPLEDLPVTRELTPEDRAILEQHLRELGYL